MSTWKRQAGAYSLRHLAPPGLSDGITQHQVFHLADELCGGLVSASCLEIGALGCRLVDLDWPVRGDVLHPRSLPNLGFGYGCPGAEALRTVERLPG